VVAHLKVTPNPEVNSPQYQASVPARDLSCSSHSKEWLGIEIKGGTDHARQEQGCRWQEEAEEEAAGAEGAEEALTIDTSCRRAGRWTARR
jgi:hypothetical protein